MAKPACTDEEFAALFTQYGATETARRLNINVRAVFTRRRSLEKKMDRALHSPSLTPLIEHPDRRELSVRDGCILVGSDAHYWPGTATTGHRGFVALIEKLKPAAVVLNGDMLDGATISRWPATGWEDRPTVADEIEVCQERLSEIQSAAKKTAKLFWLLGNHDTRLAARLAAAAPEVRGIKGAALEDHFPDWLLAWSLWINDEIVVKHRFKSAVHAPHLNTLWSGRTIITGHLHSLRVSPVTDYNSTRWGVDCGTLADAYGPQFRYLEDSPRNWRAGFVVLTFVNGELMWPELAHVVEPGVIEFRAERIEV